MKSMTIRTKLFIAFASLFLLILGLGWFSVRELQSVNGTAREMQENWLPATRMTGSMNIALGDFRIGEGVHILSTEGAEMTKAEAEMARAGEELTKQLKAYELTITSQDERRLFNDVRGACEAYLALNKELVGLSRKNQNEEAAALFKGKSRTAYEVAGKLIDELTDLNIRGGVAASERGTDLYTAARSALIGVVVVGGLFAAGAFLMISRGVSTPIRDMTDAMQKIAGGNKSVAVPALDRGDEIGTMAKALEVFKESLIEGERLRAAQEAQKKAAEEEQHKAMLKLADEFEGTVEGVVNHVASSSAEMNATASSMAAVAEQATRQSTAAAAAAEQASANVQTVASAAEELSSSIAEIGRQVAQSTTIADHAVRQAQHTNDIVSGLNTAAQKIGDVVALINNIASQTNLLALNATIEAARAGEAGKGFAVVASEVKALANQTGKATEEIAQQINSVQGATGQAVNAIQDILKTIGDISRNATMIASAVEEQQAATSEIARNVEQAAQGTQEVATNIAGVNDAAVEAGRAASQVLNEAQELSRQSEALRHEVTTFVTKVRA